jgi:hypothetical protein
MRPFAPALLTLRARLLRELTRGVIKAVSLAALNAMCCECHETPRTETRKAFASADRHFPSARSGRPTARAGFANLTRYRP